MLKTIKTTTLTTLSALALASSFTTQAQAQQQIQPRTQFASNIQTQIDNRQFNTRGAQNRSLNDFRRDRRNSNSDQILGGVVGAVTGGLIGSQIAGNGARTEGSIGTAVATVILTHAVLVIAVLVILDLEAAGLIRTITLAIMGLMAG